MSFIIPDNEEHRQVIKPANPHKTWKVDVWKAEKFVPLYQFCTNRKEIYEGL